MVVPDYQKTLQWLLEAHKAAAGKGISAGYHLLKGWSPAYPETTGYTIETLWDYHIFTTESKWAEVALRCSDWLCDIQTAQGAWHGGPGGRLPIMVFDTGMILFGLCRTFEATGRSKYRLSIEKACQWLYEWLEPEGCWKYGAFRDNFVPAYYTRVVWALLRANQILQKTELEKSMRLALQYYKKDILANGAVENWAFGPTEPAYTHTIAYTYRGFLESAILLNDTEMLSKCHEMTLKLCEILAPTGLPAGHYDLQWQGDYRFTCVTGNFQLSAYFLRCFQVYQKEVFLHMGSQLLQQSAGFQCKVPLKAIHGAFPGSYPWWKNYLPLMFPNWAAKFFLDAWLLHHRLN